MTIADRFNFDFDDAYQYVIAEKYDLTIRRKMRGHPLEGFCQAKIIFHSKKSQIFCIIKRNNTTV